VKKIINLHKKQEDLRAKKRKKEQKPNKIQGNCRIRKIIQKFAKN